MKKGLAQIILSLFLFSIIAYAQPYGVGQSKGIVNKTDDTSADSKFVVDEIKDFDSIVSLVSNLSVLKCIDAETKAEMMGIYVRYREAQRNNDTKSIMSLREDALKIREKVREQIQNCEMSVPEQKQILNTEMREVISSYTEQVKNLSYIEDVQLRNQLREQIKQETMEAVKAIVANRQMINANEIFPIVNRIHLNATTTQIGDETINVTNISVTARIRDRIMNITKTQQRLQIKENGVEAAVAQNLDITITENGTMINGMSVSITPVEAKERLRNMIVNKLEIKTEAGKLIYRAEGEENRKLLGIFQIKVQTTAQISAENGQTLNIERPWWAFLTTE